VKLSLEFMNNFRVHISILIMILLVNMRLMKNWYILIVNFFMF